MYQAKLSAQHSGQAAYDYLKNMLDNIADPIFVKDRAHRWIDGNKAFWELMGGPPEKFLGKTDYDFFPKEEADVFWAKDNTVFETGKPHFNEEFLTDFKGLRRTICTKKTLFLNESGEQVLVGIIRDITAERELEALKEYTAETVLTQKEQQYRSIFESTNDSIFIFDAEGKIVESNPAASKTYGFTHDEFMSMDGAKFCAEGDREKFGLFMEDSLAGKHFFVESIHKRKDGSFIDVEVNGTGFNYAGKPHVLAVVRDITERKKAEEELKDADRRKDEFLAMLAHELRNPLAPISNAMHIMKSPVSDSIRQEAAALVDRQINQMVHLLNDLLDVSRVTLGKIELKCETVALSEIMKMALENTKPLMDERGHTVSVEMPGHPIWLYADVTRLSQVVSNLLNNAAKYTESGGHIAVYAWEDGNQIVIKVKDNGIGITKEMQPHIFELFAQADSSLERAQGGLGIGLTLVKSIVEMHQGSTAVYSEGRGKGSEFTVRLPLADKALQGREINGEFKARPAAQAFRILVVDDNVASAKTLGWTLEMLGHEVRLAHDGAAAIDMAGEFLPHVVLLDIGLPGMNGYDVCRKLHADPRLKGIVIIAQTGWGQKEHLQRSKEAGCDYHMVKPIKIEVLQQMLEDLKRPGIKNVQSNLAL